MFLRRGGSRFLGSAFLSLVVLYRVVDELVAEITSFRTVYSLLRFDELCGLFLCGNVGVVLCVVSLS